MTGKGIVSGYDDIKAAFAGNDGVRAGAQWCGHLALGLYRDTSGWAISAGLGGCDGRGREGERLTGN